MAKSSSYLLEMEVGEVADIQTFEKINGTRVPQAEQQVFRVPKGWIWGNVFVPFARFCTSCGGDMVQNSGNYEWDCPYCNKLAGEE